MIPLSSFEAETKLTQKQIQIFKNHYDVAGAITVKLEGFTHFAVPILPKDKINDFCVFVHKENEKDDKKSGIAFVAPCHLISEDGIHILVFEMGSSLPVKGRPLQLLFDKMTPELFEVMGKFFGFS